MEISNEYRHSVWLLQAVSVLLLSVYTYLTQPLYPSNVIWFSVSLLVFVIGMFVHARLTLGIAMAAIVIYTAFQLYSLYVLEKIQQFGWNEALWLLIVPLMAVIGGIGRFLRKTATYTASNVFDIQLESNNEDRLMVDERMGYVSGTAFMYNLEEEIIVSLRDRRSLQLLVVEIAGYKEYKRAFGTTKARLLLDQTAELLNSLTIPCTSRSQFGESIFAMLFKIEEDEENTSLGRIKEELSENFFALMLTRPRREAVAKLRLVFGTAHCPADGIEARSLLQKTRDELHWNEV